MHGRSNRGTHYRIHHKDLYALRGAVAKSMEERLDKPEGSEAPGPILAWAERLADLQIAAHTRSFVSPVW